MRTHRTRTIRLCVAFLHRDCLIVPTEYLARHNIKCEGRILVSHSNLLFFQRNSKKTKGEAPLVLENDKFKRIKCVLQICHLCMCVCLFSTYSMRLAFLVDSPTSPSTAQYSAVNSDCIAYSVYIV